MSERRPADSVSWGVRVASAWALRFLVIVVAVYVVVRLLNAISLVTITTVVALMLSALLTPAVHALTRLRVPRPMAAIIVFVVGVAIISLLVWFVVSQVSANSAVLGGQLHDAGAAIRDWLVHGPLRMSQKQVDQLSNELGGAITRNKTALVAGVFATANSALGILSGAVLCLFALLFLLFDDGRIWRWVVRLFPRRAQPPVARAGGVAWRTLVAYMRSTVLLAMINSLTMVVVMVVAGLPLVVPLGVLLFLGSLIPLVGMIVAGLVVALVALVTKSLVVAVVITIALFLTVQLEGNLLNPWILGKAVDIHPLAILVTVTGGTLLGGIFGAFIAVPLVAVINNVMRSLANQSSLPRRRDGTGPAVDAELGEHVDQV